VSTLLSSAAAGLMLGVLYTASPLTVWVVLAGAVLAPLAARGLPERERRVMLAILAGGLAARIGYVALLFLAGLPHHNDMAVGALAGDEAYYLSRALRVRDLLFGYSYGNYDYFVTSDQYGRTSYLTLITWLQVPFGPTPYSLRLLNALFFMSGATLLYRTVRTGLGPAPALAGLLILLFLPSLFVSSVSLLKEPLYFLAASGLFACVVRVARARSSVRATVLTIAVAAVVLWLLNDLRRGAVVLATAGIVTGLIIRIVGATPRRLAASLVAAVMLVALALSIPSIRARTVRGVESVAKIHAGHVFTVGHAYKLMDEGFYVEPAAPLASDLRLTTPQAVRFLARAAVSFVLTPLPWEMRSRGELAFLPEHVLWYALLALLPVGIVAGWKRDPLITSLLLGVILPTAVVLALTNGNVGTLLRLRGLVTPYMLWLSALGLISVVDALAARRLWPIPFTRLAGAGGRGA
jgi:hypothetical protein